MSLLVWPGTSLQGLSPDPPNIPELTLSAPPALRMLFPTSSACTPTAMLPMPREGHARIVQGLEQLYTLQGVPHTCLTWLMCLHHEPNRQCHLWVSTPGTYPTYTRPPLLETVPAGFRSAQGLRVKGRGGYSQ